MIVDDGVVAMQANLVLMEREAFFVDVDDLLLRTMRSRTRMIRYHDASLSDAFVVWMTFAVSVYSFHFLSPTWR